DKATATKPQSKLWYTPEGIWWGTFFVASKSEYHIHRMDTATQSWIDTGVVIDDRGKSRQDCLFEEATNKLYVASRFGFNTSPPQNRLYRYTYYPGAQTYVLDAGFPVNIDGGGCEALTIAKDTTGTLWIAYMVNGQLFVNSTVGGDDRTWGTPFTPPSPMGGTVGSVDDDAAVEKIAGGKVGIFWSNQHTTSFYFSTHIDGHPATEWTQELVGQGTSLADDHFNMKVASDGRVFVAAKTSRTAPGQTLVGLFVRATNGTWSPLIKVANVDYDPTRPNFVLYAVNRKVHVMYASIFLDVYFKDADVAALVYDANGVGIPLMVSGTHPIDPNSGGPGGINNPSTTKQVVDESTGVLVIASTTET